jgi:ferredoxin
LLTDGLAGQELIDQRDRLLSRMNERHHQTRERVLAGLADILPQNVDELIQQFEDCGSCQKCMQVCPICSVDYPRPGEDQRFLPQDIMRWLVSCAGCGMCEQACPNHKPLSAIFIHIRQQLIEAFEYFPGESLQEELPIKKYP